MVILKYKNIRNFNICIAVLTIMLLIPNSGIAQGMNDNPYSNINTDQLNVIEAIGFEAKEGKAIVTIESDNLVVYETTPNESGRLTLKLRDVILAQKFQVARDVTEYDSPLSFISSFRDPVKEDDVLIVIEYKQDTDVEISYVFIF